MTSITTTLKVTLYLKPLWGEDILIEREDCGNFRVSDRRRLSPQTAQSRLPSCTGKHKTIFYFTNYPVSVCMTPCQYR